MKKMLFLGLLLSLGVESASCMDTRPGLTKRQRIGDDGEFVVTSNEWSEGVVPLPRLAAFRQVDLQNTLLHEIADKHDFSVNKDDILIKRATQENFGNIYEVVKGHQPLVNAQNIHGLAPLHVAAKFGNYPVMAALIRHGANVDLQAARGQTAMHFAAAQGDVKAINILLGDGADTNLKAEGQTPLEVAKFRRKHIVIERLELFDVKRRQAADCDLDELD